MSIDTRRRTVRGFLMASAAVLVLAGPALAQGARHTFNIPAGDAVSALQTFAKQSGKQVLFPFEAASGKRTPAVTGDVADADALARLAKAAGLVVAADDGKTITLRSAPAEVSASPLPQSSSVGARATEEEAQVVETVVVVGSQIEGARTTEALPVTVVGENDIIATGAVSGDELFRSIPQAGDVQFQEARTTGNLNDARGDVASLNLRSLGTGNTLALLNGRRAVLAPGSQTENLVPVQTVNTNSFPVAGIKRVEVLRDGAAAIYGTDAVAGVVNTVLDTRFRGLRIEAQYGGSEGTSYREGSVNLKAGTRLEDGTRLTFFGSYTSRSRLMATERDYAASEDHRAQVANTPWVDNTTFDSRATASPWGSFTVIPSTTTVRQGTTALTTSGVFHVEPVGNTAAGCSSTVLTGNLCLKSGTITGAADRALRYDENPDRTLKGGVERTNLFSTVEHEIGKLTAYGEAGYYHALFTGSREQSAPLSTAPISIAANAYWNPFGPTTSPNRLAGLTGVPTTGLAMNITTYRPVDTGPRTYTVTDDSYRLLGGLKGAWNGWKWDSAMLYSAARTKDMTHDAISNTLFQQAVNRTDVTAYNPFNGGSLGDYSVGDATPNDRATINAFLINVYRISKTSLALADFKVSKKDLFTLPGGDVGFAAGVEWRRETYKDDRDDRLDGKIKYTNSVTGVTYGTDVMGASGAPDISGRRSVTSAFFELAVPIISPEMNIPFVEEISLQIAARDEDYSDFGNVLKPKGAIYWKVGQGLAIRGSVSQSFRAPNLPQFYSDGSTVSNTRTDYAACRINTPTVTTCPSGSTIEVRSGNKNLRPEEADNATVGFVYQPTFIPRQFGALTLTTDFWSIREKNIIGILGGGNQIAYDWLLRQGGSSNPNVVRDAPVGTAIVGNIAYIQDTYQNLQPRMVQGVDFSLDYDLDDTAWGDFGLNVNVAKLLKYDQSPSPIESLLQQAVAAGSLPGVTIASAGNQIKMDGFPEFRGTASFTWRYNGWGAGAFVNYVGEVYDTGPAQVAGQYFPVKAWTTVNLYAQYAFKDGRFDGSTVRVGVRNVGDKDPPIASSNFGYLGALHNATGRYWYMNLSKRF
ncbi:MULTISPECIES: TonB-dependent receptor domain-containing protein [unclassified Caulobacter]|uniref:TonB-dependent receptor domain-containing protein n=1 Tax=unclassified Caulobacter TaxID=2648921 RepID=UPI0006F681E4|nr:MULTISPECIES: TonB-dependent receptor [unclassified Caulobacter]KQV58744.1 TonB-dependent receptor [Caulobacter sp. Root342]KQV68747.1 TonB-dependent receptor [Caulobacter sp. Root343]